MAHFAKQVHSAIHNKSWSMSSILLYKKSLHSFIHLNFKTWVVKVTCMHVYI